MSPSSSSYCRLNTAAVCKAGGALGEATSPGEAADAAGVPGSLTFAGHVCMSLQHRTHPRSRHKQKTISPTKRRTWRWTAEKTEKSKTRAERADALSPFLMLNTRRRTLSDGCGLNYSFLKMFHLKCPQVEDLKLGSFMIDSSPSVLLLDFYFLHYRLYVDGTSHPHRWDTATEWLSIPSSCLVKSTCTRSQKKSKTIMPSIIPLQQKSITDCHRGWPGYSSSW